MYGRSKVLCRCDCGTEKVVSMNNLRTGNTKSCGCFHRDQTSKANTTHGDTKNYGRSRMYTIWANMRARCRNPKSKSWQWYGARGISVCAEWTDDFAAFEKWAMANGYSAALSLDRIDNDGDYAPDNCRWTTVKEQANNRRTNRLLAAFGEVHTAAEWVDDPRCGVLTPGTLLRRIADGWDVEDAISIPTMRRSK